MPRKSQAKLRRPGLLRYRPRAQLEECRLQELIVRLATDDPAAPPHEIARQVGVSTDYVRRSHTLTRDDVRRSDLLYRFQRNEIDPFHFAHC